MATTLADTIATVLPYLRPLVGAVTAASHTPPDVAAKIQAAMDGVESGVTALAASDSAAQSQPIVQRIEADALSVLQVASSLPLPPPFSTIAMVASFLLPSLFSAVNLLVATKTAVPAAP